MSESTTGSVSSASPQKARVDFIDWLRVLAMFAVFLFHNARFYDAISDWHVRNSTTDPIATYSVGFMSIWMMPLFFILAGASTFYALKTRAAGQFVKERALRLLVPLVFGILILNTPQVYYEAVFHKNIPAGANPIALYPSYLANLSLIPLGPTYHLWFLQFLFIFSVVALPLFLRNSKTGASVLSRAAGAFSRPWVLLIVPGLAVGLVNVFLYPSGFFGSNDSGGWNFVSYLLVYLLGYVMFADPRVLETVKRYGWVGGIIGAVTGGIATVFFVGPLLDPAKAFGSLSYSIGELLKGVCCVSLLILIVHLGAWYLNRKGRFLSYASDAVLPFYILHQTVIISIGFYVVPLDLAVGLKYLIISTSSFVVIMAIYELLVRRIGVLRFLFGMRGKKKALTR